ncbi:MAG: PucR family transcriptional regulator ligand-binding domain-containing protein [Firmicutes bacterium]|nr:PucR family transcriptional regulator ligand-binding domain-containing protein [Bacillota bacterium]
MKVTIKDCLGLDSFMPHILAAGKDHLDRRVRAISVMDAVDAKSAKVDYKTKDLLVLTSFSGVSSEDEKCRIISTLAENGISGIVVLERKGFNSVPSAKVTAAAESIGMPLIVLPKENNPAYSDIIVQVTDQITYGESFKNSLINNTIYHLMDFERHSSFESALREAAVHNEFQLVLLSRDFNPILTVETRQRTSVADAIRFGKERDVEKSNVYTFVDVNGLLTYWGPIIVAGEKYFLLIVDNEDNYSAGEITKLAEVIELAMGMWKYTPEWDVRAEFIKALSRSNKSLAYSLKDEIGISGGDIMSVFFATGIEPSGNKIFAECEKAEKLEIMRIVDGDETYGVILKQGNKPETAETTQKAGILHLFDRLKEGNKSVRIFHVTDIDGLEGAGDAFRLISESWTFVEGVFPYKRVFTKYELALVSNCINLQVQGGYLKKNYTDLLEPFWREMGENKARQLLDTLETFVLDAGMNSSKTSEFMGIHTNTVQYRLKRINEVLGAEITGNRIIPGLTMALALKRLERVVK